MDLKCLQNALWLEGRKMCVLNGLALCDQHLRGGCGGVGVAAAECVSHVWHVGWWIGIGGMPVVFQAERWNFSGYGGLMYSE